MAKKKEKPVLFCRFLVDGRTYSGQIRENSVDIVEGDPFTTIYPIRLSYPADRVKFLPPFMPRKIWCVGRNYANHVKELNHEMPTEPTIFMKPPTCVIGSSDFIRIPQWAGRVDYEGELAVIIGKSGRNIEENDALEHVLGYSIINDVTARDLQNKDGQWTRSKGFDTFAPFGPALLVQKQMPAGAAIHTRLNDKVVQESTFEHMIFSIPVIIAFISRFATIEAGDIIATGTPGGIGPMKAGDVVEVEIDGIGKLRNICAD